ncbi:MAG: NAD-dependent epimerase/dehydratase family protein [Bacteroidales bacterium]|nr:NAD-dependent epimerase/dehydratase family protein [Bacteroidales bacterium]
MKVLLLGATGLLGHNVLQRLTDTGHQVVAVVRRRKSLQVETPDTMVVEGRITDRDTVMAAVEGCDAIVNCAGVTDMSLLHQKDYYAVNIGLCHSLVDAMNKHGIRRLVHISTVNTIGYGTREHPADENNRIKAPFSESYYADSKLGGEYVIREAATMHDDWHVVVINPGYMLGPMDVKPSSGRMLLMGYRKPLAFAPTGGKAFVDVRDVAVAVVNALTMGGNGCRYIAVNRHGHHTISELYQLQAQVMGYRQRVVTVPDRLLLAAGFVGDAVRALGVRTELSTRNVRQLMVREYYDSSLAVNVLQMSETDIAQSIRDFHAWRAEKGKRKRKRTKENIQR